MNYALVKISRNRWIVAQESEVCKNEFRTVTHPLTESLARRIYNEIRFMGIERVPKDVKDCLL